MNSIFGKEIYTGKRIIKNSYLVFQQQKIVDISPEQQGKLLGKFPVITPAFIDPHSHIGMSRFGEPASEGEINDKMDSALLIPDALDSIQMDDVTFKKAIELGVLYSCVLPGSGNVLGGRSVVIRHYAKDTTSAAIARAGIKAAFGYNTMSDKGWHGTRPSTRMGAVSILRRKFSETLKKMQKKLKAKGKQRQELELTAEELVLEDILTGKERLRAHAHKIDDIAALLRIVDEFGLKNVSVEHAMDVHQPEIFQELKKRNIPVIYGPVDSLGRKVELKHLDWRNIRMLMTSGVEYGLMTDNPVVSSSNLLFQTRWFTRNGLSKQQAIELISLMNSRILGIDKCLGSLERNKWASFSCWNGDPFDIVNYPLAVYGEGKLLYESETKNKGGNLS